MQNKGRDTNVWQQRAHVHRLRRDLNLLRHFRARRGPLELAEPTQLFRAATWQELLTEELTVRRVVAAPVLADYAALGVKNAGFLSTAVWQTACKPAK